MRVKEKPDIFPESSVYDIEAKVGQNDVLIRLRNPPEIYRRKGENDREFYSRLIKSRPEAAVFISGRLASMMDRYNLSEKLLEAKKLPAKTKEKTIVRNPGKKSSKKGRKK